MGMQLSEFWQRPYHEMKELEKIMDKYHMKEKQELETQASSMKSSSRGHHK